MNRSFSSIIILIVTSYTIFSQNDWLPKRPYEKIDFINAKPIWYETVYDASSVGDTCDGYNFKTSIFGLEPLIVDDYYYYAYAQRGKSDLFTGAVIEKRRLTDGKLIWQSSYNYKDAGRQEVPRYLEINDNGDLEIICFKRIAPYKVNDPYNFAISGISNKMNFSKRVYNSMNGNLNAYYLNGGINAPLLSFRPYGSSGSSNLYRLFKNKWKFLRLDYNWKNYVLRNYTLDNEGNIISLDSVILQNKPYDFNLKQLDDKTYRLIDLDSSKAIIIYSFDEEFNLTNEVKTEKIADIKQPKLLAANKDKIVIESYVKAHGDSTVMDIIELNKDGNLLKKNRYFNKFARVYQLFDFESSDDIYLMGLSTIRDTVPTSPVQYDATLPLEIYKSNDVGGFDVVKSLVSKDKHRFANLDKKAVKLANNDYMLFLNEGAIDTIYPWGSIWGESASSVFSTMRFTQSSLGLNLPVSTIELPPSKYELTISPNPAHDFIFFKINSNSDVSKIIQYNIKNINDITVSKGRYENQNIPIEKLPIGLYFITLIDEKGKIFMQKFIKS